MKTTKIILICSFMILFNGSCSKSNPPEDFFVTNLTSGNWTISYYSFDGTENSADIFDGYVLHFLENRNVRATKNGSTINGHWEITHSDLSTFLYLDFNVSGDFEGLNRTWIYYGNGLDEIALHNDDWSETLRFSKYE